MQRKHYRTLTPRRKRKGKQARPARSKAHSIPSPFRPRASRQLKPLLDRIGVPKAAPFVPDPFQLEAVAALQESDVLVTAATGSGKTWIALKAMEKLLSRSGRAWYASPLKALSNSKYVEFGQQFGKKRVGILTGDRKENPRAPIIVGTTEILRNQLYDSMYQGDDLGVDLVVLDEAHYLGDEDRGVVWEEVFIYLPARIRLLLLSATVSNAKQISAWLEWLRHVPCQIIAAHKRPVPLHPFFMFPDGEVTPLVKGRALAGKVRHFIERNPRAGLTPRKGVANISQIISALRHLNLLPAIFFLKSRSDCNLALSAALPRLNPNESDEKRRRFHTGMRKLLQAHPYLKRHRQLGHLYNGRVAAHHGGQLPQWKVLVEAVMNQGELEAIFSTSTVAAGVNFPARTVVLSQSDRFNGREFVSLSATDLLQMTGRAGRRGMDEVGFVMVLPGPYQKPHLICDLLHSSPEPIASQIKINFSMVLNLLLSHRAEEIRELLSRSLATYQNLENYPDLLQELQRLESELAVELGSTACGDVDSALRTLAQKRNLEQQLDKALRKLRGSWTRLLKQAHLTPGRLFSSKKGEFFLAVNQVSRNNVDGVSAIHVGPEIRLRRRLLRQRWLPLEKVASVLDGTFDLPDQESPESWLESVNDRPLARYEPLKVEEPLPSPEQEAWETVKGRVAELQAALADLPCDHCRHRDQCEPKKHSRFRQKINTALTLRHRLDAVTNQLWHEFDRHYRFLQEENYVDEAGGLSHNGVWASQLRLDQPLMIAEGIRHDVFPQEDPAMLAGLVACFVGDRDSHSEPLQLLEQRCPDLRQAFMRMVSALNPLRFRLRQQGFVVNPLSFWPATTIYIWVSEGQWEEVLEISGLDEGDLAMLIYRTADGLRQLEGLFQSHPRLAATSTRAIQHLLREPVLVPT